VGSQLNTYHLVEAPAPVPYRHGLFSVAEPRVVGLVGGTIDEHWRLGVTWQSQACSLVKETTGPCIDAEVEPLTPDEYCSVAEFDPFTVYAYNDDAVPGHTLTEHEANAIARLTAGEQLAAEKHVWSQITTAAGAATDLTGFNLKYALGWVEQALAERYGSTGVIHMSRLAVIMARDLLRVEGARLTTYGGTPVVAGGGYDVVGATTPATATIFATGPLVLYRGEVDVRQNAIDKAINSVSIIAQRDYVLGWDCVAFGADVTLATPGGS
jgi:hypothetical protein